MKTFSLLIIALLLLQPTSYAAAKDGKPYVLSQSTITKLIEEMVWVEGGSFIMGSDKTTALKREQPQHQVTIDGFYIAKTEVTQALFKELMGWNYSYFPCDNCAVNNISWFNMQLFIQRLNKVTGKIFRLPTEAEWEYAAKGGQKSQGYIYSGSNNIEDVAWYSKNSKRKSQQVAQKLSLIHISEPTRPY